MTQPKTPSEARIAALITYLEVPMALDVACDMAMVDPAFVVSALKAAYDDDGSHLAVTGARIKAAQAEAVTAQIGSVLSKSRKDWKPHMALLQAIDPRFAPKSGLKELGKGLGEALLTVIELPAREQPPGLALPDKDDE